MSLKTDTITIEAVKADIEAEDEQHKKKMRHLRALLRVLQDEADGQPTLFDKEE